MTVASIVAGKVAALRASGNAEVRTVKPDVTVAEAIRRMRDELVGALVVSEDGTSILGIISDRGIVDALADHGVDVLKDRVRSVMTEGVLTCSADDRVGAIMAAMVARRIRHIPVVDEEGWLRGLVSMSDVVKYQLHEVQAEADAMREYISGR
jgi:CBS domain-containing protein